MLVLVVALTRLYSTQMELSASLWMGNVFSSSQQTSVDNPVLFDGVRYAELITALKKRVCSGAKSKRFSMKEISRFSSPLQSDRI